ncbi:MAG: pentapeptide repeat-containing protein [Paracoccaceae bacterium]
MSEEKLKPAEQNLWYLLLTVYDEQGEGFDYDRDLHARNRRIWNGWALGHLDEATRQKWADIAEIQMSETEPLTEDEMSAVRARFVEVLGEHFELPKPESMVEFENVEFKANLVAEQCVFLGVANFGRATFTQEAIFGRATFTQWAIFAGATFTEWTYFAGATFTQAADFGGATFKELAFFNEATFTQRANFRSATFDVSANFESAAFSRWAIFQNATFKQTAIFLNTSFNSETNFTNTTFGEVPRIHQATMHEATYFTRDAAYWPKPDAKTAERSADDYSRLRQFMNKLQKPDDEHFFLRQELACKAMLGGWWHRLPIRLYGWVSDYGYSLLRPTIGLAATWLVPFLAYLVAFSWCHVLYDGGEPWGPAFGLSIASSFGFFGFNRVYYGELFSTAPDWLMFMTGLQTILGFIFLFFLGLGLRNRFRLR